MSVMTNINKMQFVGKTPKCVECNKFYSGKKLTSEQRQLAENTGLCPICQGNHAIVSKYVKTEKKVSAKKSVKVSAASKIRVVLEDTITNENQVALLMDKAYTIKLTGIKYPFLKEINQNEDVHQQLLVNGRARYSKKTYSFNGRVFAMTNDLYDRNVDRTIDMLNAIKKIV